MRKILLTTTLIAVTAVSTNAWSFGGLGILGHKSNHKAGVNAIGVHIDADNKEQPNIEIRSCDSETEELVGTECCKKTLIYTDNDTTKCCSTEGYAVQDGKCKKQCGEGLVLNEETNECEDACPVARQCGETCCGEGQTCNEGQCCDGNGNCCASGIPYIAYQEEGNDAEIECCVNGTVFTYINNENGFAQGCCEKGRTLINVGNLSACCETGETAYISDDGATCCDGTIWNDNTCCPAGTTSFSDLDGCCEAGTTETWQLMGGGDARCCPIGSIGYDPDNGDECIME